MAHSEIYTCRNQTHKSNITTSNVPKEMIQTRRQQSEAGRTRIPKTTKWKQLFSRREQCLLVACNCCVTSDAYKNK